MTWETGARAAAEFQQATGHPPPKNVFAFIPDLPLNQEWTDARLYKRYGLTQDEIGFIESQVAEHDTALFEDVAVDDVEDE